MTSTTSRTLRALLLVGMVAVPLRAQVVETTICLPDSAGGVLRPEYAAYNPTNGYTYMAGGQWTSRVVALDGESGRRVASIDVAAGITALCCNPAGNKLYVAHGVPPGVTVISCSEHRVVSSLAFGDSPVSLCYNPVANKIYCADNYDSHVYIISGTGDSLLGSVQFMREPYEMHLTCNTRDGKVYCIVGFGVGVIDGEADTIRAYFDTGGYPSAICYNPVANKIYVADGDDDRISIIDAGPDTVLATCPTGDQPSALASCAAENKVYCANFEAEEFNVVTAICGSGDSVVAAIDIPEFYEPTVIAWCPSSNEVCVYDEDRHLGFVNCRTDSVSAVIETPLDEVRALCVDDSSELVMLAGYRSAAVVAVSVETHSVETFTPIGMEGLKLCLDAGNRKLYCVGRAGDSVSVAVIDAATLAVIGHISIGRYFDQFDIAWDLVADPVNDKVYCTDRLDSAVVAICCNGDTVVARTAVGFGPHALEYNPVGGKLYVANIWESTVTVLDCASDSVRATTNVSGQPFDLCLNSLDNKIYAPFSDNNGVAVIDAVADTLLTSMPIRYPVGICYNRTNNKVYCSSGDDDDITVVDGGGDTIITVIQAGWGYGDRGLVYNSANNSVYFASDGYNVHEDSVSVVDGGSNQVEARFDIPYDTTVTCCELICDASRNRIYGASRFVSDVGHLHVIDGGTDSVVARLPVGRHPTSLCVDRTRGRVFVASKWSSNISVVRDTAAAIGEGGAVRMRTDGPTLVVGGQLLLTAQGRGTLVDVGGRRIATLQPGRNAVSVPAPGVYILVDHDNNKHTKLVVLR